MKNHFPRPPGAEGDFATIARHFLRLDATASPLCVAPRAPVIALGGPDKSLLRPPTEIKHMNVIMNPNRLIPGWTGVPFTRITGSGCCKSLFNEHRCAMGALPADVRRSARELNALNKIQKCLLHFERPIH